MMADTCHYTFVQTYSMYNTTLMGDVDSGGSPVFVRAGFIWEMYVLSSQFCCESKTASKMPIKTIIKFFEIKNVKEN